MEACGAKCGSSCANCLILAAIVTQYQDDGLSPMAENMFLLHCVLFASFSNVAWWMDWCVFEGAGQNAVVPAHCALVWLLQHDGVSQWKWNATSVWNCSLPWRCAFRTHDTDWRQVQRTDYSSTSSLYITFYSVLLLQSRIGLVTVCADRRPSSSSSTVCSLWATDVFFGLHSFSFCIRS